MSVSDWRTDHSTLTYILLLVDAFLAATSEYGSTTTSHSSTQQGAMAMV